MAPESSLRELLLAVNGLERTIYCIEVRSRTVRPITRSGKRLRQASAERPQLVAIDWTASIRTDACKVVTTLRQMGAFPMLRRSEKLANARFSGQCGWFRAAWHS